MCLRIEAGSYCSYFNIRLLFKQKHLKWYGFSGFVMMKTMVGRQTYRPTSSSLIVLKNAHFSIKISIISNNYLKFSQNILSTF